MLNASYIGRWGTRDAEIKVPYAENVEVSKVSPLRLRVGQNTALPASSTAKILAFKFLVSSFFFFFSTSFFGKRSLNKECSAL